MQRKFMNKKFFLLISLFLFYISSCFSQDLNEFVIVESYRVHDLNPQTTSYSSDAQLLTGLYEGLFSYDPVTLAPVYAIATDYRISRDKKRWTFTINPNAYFNNGEKITAMSVRDSWLQLLETPDAPYASLLDVIKGAAEYRSGKGSVEDVAIFANTDDSLTIHLVKPANYLPKVLCHSAFSVIHRNPTVYSGAFYLNDYKEGYYQLKKNPYYWDKDNVALDTITFVQCDSTEDNAYYFNIGYADWITAPVYQSMLLNKNAFQINAEFATSYFFFKQNHPIWNNVDFRTALFEAIPWDKIREGYYVPATTFVYPLNGYPEIDGYSYTDLAEAKNLMKAARERYGLSDDEIIPLFLEVGENSFPVEKLEALSDAWAQLGVELLIKYTSNYDYLNGVATSDSQIFVYTWIGDFADPLAFLELFRSDSTLNDSHWQNSEYDQLLEKAAQVSESERYKLLGEAENLLLDNCVVIPIQHPVISNIIDTQAVGGWSTNAFDIHPLKYLYKKTVKTSLPNVVMLK